MTVVRRLTLFMTVTIMMCLTEMQATADTNPVQTPSTETTETEEAAADVWSYSASSYIYIVPDDQNYASAIFTADKDWLHIEARYNYEDLRTGSAWVGYNLSFGEKLVFDATPMFGGVFGNLNGVAPGWEISLSYAKVEFYSESEYVFDLEDSSGNFYYNWSELTYSPADWLQLGLVFQRTKAYQTDLDVQRGFLAGFSYKMVNVSTYVFNLGWEKPTFSVSAGLNF